MINENAPESISLHGSVAPGEAERISASPPLTLDDVEPAPEPTDDDRRRVTNLALRLREKEREVIARTAALKEVLTEYHQLAQRELPEALTAIGQSEFKLLDGTPVALDETISTTQLDEDDPEDRPGLQWVENHGGMSLVRTTVIIEMDRGDLDKARELVAELRRHRYANQFKLLHLARSIHAQTLRGWIGELLKGGGSPPLETLRATRLTRARVGAKRPKTVDLKGLVER